MSHEYCDLTTNAGFCVKPLRTPRNQNKEINIFIEFSGLHENYTFLERRVAASLYLDFQVSF